jgi:hypothetical protein
LLFRPSRPIANEDVRTTTLTPSVIIGICSDHGVVPKKTKPPDLEKANKVVQRTLEIIDYFKPKFWFIENPDGGKLKEQEFMKDLPYHRVSYCMYGYDYRKTTRIWTNNREFQPKLCVRGSCGKTIGRRHLASIGQKKFLNLSQKYSYPPELVRDLLQSCRQGNANTYALPLLEPLSSSP